MVGVGPLGRSLALSSVHRGYFIPWGETGDAVPLSPWDISDKVTGSLSPTQSHQL